MLIINLLLIFKFYIYSARNTKQLNFDNLKKTIKKIKELEKELTESIKMKLLRNGVTLLIDISFKVKREGGRGRLISFPVYFYFIFFYLFPFYLFFCIVHL